MKEAVFRYHCRHCGVTYDGACMGPQNASLYLLMIGLGHKTPGIPQSMTDIHHCDNWSDDSRLGVSDLIGTVTRETT